MIEHERKFKDKNSSNCNIRIEIISERRNNLDIGDNLLAKNHKKKDKEATKLFQTLPSSLTHERRLEIIEEILKEINQKNLVDEIRRANAISFQLPK